MNQKLLSPPPPPNWLTSSDTGFPSKSLGRHRHVEVPIEQCNKEGAGVVPTRARCSSPPQQFSTRSQI